MSTKLSEYDYDLPDELVADQPPTTRGTSRLLVVDRSNDLLADQRYPDMVDYMQPGDVVVLNDTKVIPARLLVHKKDSGVPRELILLEQHGNNADWHRHEVLYRRRLSVGDVLIAADGSELMVETVKDAGIAVVSSRTDLLDLALTSGAVPLPPYMHRAATAADTERYQTVWARQAGSVAAPTASLNMTEATLERLRKKGVTVCYLTLHVGLGTFLPIRTDDVRDHTMHQEYFEIPAATVATIQTAKANGAKVTAIGTTVTRTLEYAAETLLQSKPQDMHGEADIFMYPGYKFKLVDHLLTNFHAPRSTVLMLTAAFAGWPQLKRAYEHATAQQYQFLSYGDSMLIL